MQYRVSSRLLIVTGCPNAEKAFGRYYYLWEGNELKLLKYEKLKSWPGEDAQQARAAEPRQQGSNEFQAPRGPLTRDVRRT
jgi:hypothetical protein